MNSEESLDNLENSVPFTEPQGSLPSSQEPASGPYLGQNKYSPVSIPVSSRSSFISSHLHLGFPTGLCLSDL